MIFINHDDLRSLELMELCLQKGYYVTDRVQDIKYADVIYLGAKGIDRKNRLFMNDETIVLSNDIFDNLKEDCTLITLIKNTYLEELSIEKNFHYIVLQNLEDFIVKNSILTAEGLLSYIISHRRFPIYESNIMVLGFGNSGKPIVQYLKALGAKVYVATKNKNDKEEISKLECIYRDIQNIKLNDIDILINTIPSVIVDEQELNSASSDLMIIDIASYPYGINHHYALSKGINSIILPSIPCKYAYGYAGQLIFNIIERVIGNE